MSTLQRALHFRTVSVASDEPLCISTLMNLDTGYIASATTAEERMARVWEKLLQSQGGIAARVLFYLDDRIDIPGWRWAPKSLLASSVDEYVLTLNERFLRFNTEHAQSMGTPTLLGLKFTLPGYRLIPTPVLPGLPLHPWPEVIKPREDQILLQNKETGQWDIDTGRCALLVDKESAVEDGAKAGCLLQVEETPLRNMATTMQGHPHGSREQSPPPLHARRSRSVIMARLTEAESQTMNLIRRLAEDVARSEHTAALLEAHKKSFRPGSTAWDTAAEKVRQTMKHVMREAWLAHPEVRQTVKDTVGEGLDDYVWVVVPKWVSHKVALRELHRDQRVFYQVKRGSGGVTGSCARLLALVLAILKNCISSISNRWLRLGRSVSVSKMLPAALVSTYQQYKEDTNSIAAWLASTAKAAGFSVNVLSPESSGASIPASSRRLKGKARVKAKKQAARLPAKPSAAPTQSTYIIGIKDFITLAEYIASKAVAVPRELGKTIQRVINARSGFGSRLENHGQVVPELSAARHTHFVGVLEKVRQVLSPLMPTETSDETTSQTSELSNRFANLVVFEPSSEFLNAPDFERPKQTQDDPSRYESEPMDSLEEAFFALTALVNDMNQVKSQVRWIWSNYNNGMFDLAAAAIATNTAIDLVRNMTEDVNPLLELHGGLGQMLEQFHVMQCLLKGWSRDELVLSTKDSFNDNFNYEAYDVAEGTYLAAYRMLESFVAILQPEEIPLYKEGMFGYFDPNSDRSKKTGRQKFVDDRALIMPYLSELMTVLRGFDDWLVKDEFIRGMEELDKTKQVPFYAVFAAQIFLDISYELGPDIERPFNTMMVHMNFMDNDLKEHFQFHAKMKIDNWPASNDALLRELHRHIHWIQSDPVRAIQTRMRRRIGAPVPDIESHRLFRMSPVISGLVLYHFRGRYHDAGIALANAWGSIQYCQHLSNAVQLLVPGAVKWPDMDVVYTNLGPDSFFVGNERPKTLADCFLKFSLQMGTSVAAMSARRRKKTSLVSKAGPRGFKEGVSPVQAMFAPRYVQRKGQFGLTPEHVNRIIELSLFEYEGSEEEGRLILGQIEDPEKLKEKKKMWHQQQPHRGQGSRKTSSKAPRKKVHDGGRMTVEQLIEQLALVLNAEMLEFSFPYMHMHRECWQVLRAVRKSCDALLRELYTPAYMERESELPFVVGWILIAASGIDDGVVDFRPLRTAAKALHEVLAATGTGDVIIRQDLGEKLGMPVWFVTEGDSDAGGDEEAEDDSDDSLPALD
ncbi:hypothetical protein E4U41_005999 [Claviceps citrina]|nr:hypothetical protein E4U41_005999 [Claviceps citrina]